MATVSRKRNGTFRKGSTGNIDGKPCLPSKGRKTEIAKNKLDNKLFKAGVEAIDIIQKVMIDATQAKDNNTALKAAFWIGNEYIKLILHNQKLMIEEAKGKAAESVKDDETSTDEDEVTFEIDLAS